MRDDHTYEGIPVAQISTSDVVRLIRDGIHIDSMHDFKGTIKQAEEAVIKRLQIELTIRLYNLR